MDPSYSPSTKSEIKKSQFLKLGELDNQSPLFDESAKASKENSFFANLRRQTTRAVKIFLDQEIVNEEVKEEADEYNIEENDNHSKKSEQTIKQIKSSMSLEELRNLNKEEIEKKEENNYIEENSYLESELSELSDLSVDKIKEMQKDRKRYNEHILKSKRKTIGMRLAFLAPSSELFITNMKYFTFYIFNIIALQKTFKKTERNYSVNAEIAKTLLEKILEKKLNNKIKNAFSINTVLKLIGQIYTERLSSNQNINNPLYVMIYDLFLNKYGLKKICEVKYFQVF